MANVESFLTFNSFNFSPLTVDLNHIFLFLAVISPLLVLARGWRPGAPYHGWRIAAIVVLGVTAVAWILAPRTAGYIGGLVWALTRLAKETGNWDWTNRICFLRR